MSYGIDTTRCNNDQQTALDIVKEHSMATHTSQEIAALIKGEKKPFPDEEAEAAQNLDRSELVKTPYDNLPGSPDYQTIPGDSDDSAGDSPTMKLGYLNLPPLKTPPKKPVRLARPTSSQINPVTSNSERVRTGSFPGSERNAPKMDINTPATNGSVKMELTKLEIIEPLYDELPLSNKLNETDKPVGAFTEVPPSLIPAAFGGNSGAIIPGADLHNVGAGQRSERVVSEVDSPPPLIPDRNYYDEDVAGTYAKVNKLKANAEAAAATASGEDQGNKNNARPSKLEVSSSSEQSDSSKTPEAESIYALLSDATSGSRDSSPSSSGPPSKAARPATKPKLSEKPIAKSNSPGMTDTDGGRQNVFPLKPVPRRPPDLPLLPSSLSVRQKPTLPNKPSKPSEITRSGTVPVRAAPKPPTILMMDENKRNSLPLNNNVEKANRRQKAISGYVEMKPILTPTSPTEYDQPPTPDHPPPSANAASLEIHSKFHAQLLSGPNQETDSPRNSTATDITESSNSATTSDSEAEAVFELPRVAAVTTSNTSTNDGEASNPHLSTISEGTEVSSRSEERKEVFIIDSKETAAVETSGFSDKSSDMMSVSTDSSSEPEILRPDGVDPFAGLIQGSGYNRSSPKPVNFDLSPIDSPEKVLSPVHLSRVSQSTESLESPDFDEILQQAAEGTMNTGQSGESGRGREDSAFLDENKEWQQVSDILSSIGLGMVRESVYSRDLEDQFTKMMSASIKPENVAQWLEKLGLLQYENTFLAKGFDDLNFLNGRDILDEQDLLDMDIQEKNHRQLILESAKLLPSFKPIEESSIPSSVEEWLTNLHLSDYIDRFHKMGFSTMERIRTIWEVELTNVIEINTLGHRKRILASLSVISLKRSAPAKKSFRPLSFTLSKNFELDWNMSPLEENGAVGNESEDRSSQASSSLENIDLFRDYSKLKPTLSQQSLTKSSQNSPPPTTYPPVPSRHSSRNRGNEYENVQVDPLANTPFTLDPGQWADDSLHIRKPKLANSDRQTMWRHPSDKLIDGNINYQASYLGSQLIKELKGTESTREACAKLRKSTRNIEKIPSITLSINYKGVKFIDACTNIVITEHSIRNISCAAQDPDDLKVFAYITRDDRAKKEYCHVFSVTTSDLGAEIILTLGQCFEVAYQMLVKEKSGEVNPLYKQGDMNPLYDPQQ